MIETHKPGLFRRIRTTARKILPRRLYGSGVPNASSGEPSVGPLRVSGDRNSTPTKHQLIVQAKARQKAGGGAPTMHQLIQLAQRRKDQDVILQRARLADGLNRGLSLSESAVDIARLVTPETRNYTRSVLTRLVLDDSSRKAGCTGMAVFLLHDGFAKTAWQYFNAAGLDAANEVAPVDLLDTNLLTENLSPDDAPGIIAQIRDRLSSNEWYYAMTILARHRLTGALEAELELVGSETLSTLDEQQRRQVDLWRHLLQRPRKAAPQVDGAIHIGVMDYKNLERRRTSHNRGDYVQTLAAISHLLRFDSVEYVGGSKLAAYLTLLKSQVHPERRISDLSARVVPVPIDRDFASGRSYPEHTWLISNGWFMHRAFNGAPDFPYPDEINPIFISFHIQDPGILTDAVVSALKSCSPIGCRDWSTVYRLRDHGIPAFFSGCVTTTVGQIVAQANPDGSHRAAWVEPKDRHAREDYEGWEFTEFIQVKDDLERMDLPSCIEDAREMLNTYSKFDRVITSRLHCYLPTRSMGLSVDFRPANRADIRFEGLLDLSAAEFDAIRSSLEQKLEALYRAILSGADRHAVYSLWRDLTRDDVLAAERHAEDHPDVYLPSFDVEQAIATLQRTKQSVGKPAQLDRAVNLALALDKQLEPQLAAVVESIVSHTDSPCYFHVLGRSLSVSLPDRMTAMFPSATFDFYDCSEVDYGKNLHLLAHTSVSTLDRILLPDLLTALDRVVYLDIDVAVFADISTLYRMELGDAVVAGRFSSAHGWSNLVRPLTRASLLHPVPEAWTLRRYFHSKLTPGPTANAGVMVFDLAAMRREKFCPMGLGLVERCSLNDQDAINLFAAGRIRPLPAGWNVVPSQEFVELTPPKLVHWAGPDKPWSGEHYVAYGEAFTRFRDDANARYCDHD